MLIMNITTEIVLGTNLKQEDLDLVNEYRVIRLGRNRIWDHKINNQFQDRLFFLVRDDNKLVSFGTLRSLKVMVDKREVEILGMQAIISIIQGKGYGKILINKMVEYAKESKQTIVGFCEPKNAEFYKKSGMEVFTGKNQNFIHVSENGNEYTEDGDVIYYSNNSQQIKTTLEENNKITHKFPHW